MKWGPNEFRMQCSVCGKNRWQKGVSHEKCAAVKRPKANRQKFRPEKFMEHYNKSGMKD